MAESKNVSKNLKQHVSNPCCVDQMLCSLCGNQLACFSSKKAKIQRRMWKIQWKFHEKEDLLGYIPQKNLTVYQSSPPIIWIISRSSMKAVTCILINKKAKIKIWPAFLYIRISEFSYSANKLFLYYIHLRVFSLLEAKFKAAEKENLTFQSTGCPKDPAWLRCPARLSKMEKP